MLGGKCFEADWWEMKLTLAPTLSRSSSFYGFLASATIESGQTTVTTAIGQGFKLWAQIGDEMGGGTAATDVGFDCAGLSITRTKAITGTASVTQHIEIENLKVYVMAGPGWRVKGDNLKWYVNGGLEYTHGSFTINGVLLSPAGLPLMGIPAVLAAGASTNPVPALSPGVPAAYSVSAHAAASGGWRFKIGATWYALPVTLDYTLPTALSCGGAAPGDVAVTATDTYDLACEALDTQTAASSFILEHKASSVYAWPDLAASVKRWGGADSGALIVRGGFPQTKKSLSATCTETETEHSASVVTTPEVHATQSQFLALVREAAHTIEDPLGRIAYAPHSVGSSVDLITATRVWHSARGAAFPTVQTRASNTDMMSYIDHDEDIARYANYWGCPHWSYGYFFPPDSDTTHWKISAAKENSDDYWVPLRTQHLTHSSLPTGEKPGSRNSLVSAPLQTGDLDTWFKSNVIANAKSSWWGVHRFKVQAPDPDVSNQLTSGTSAAWSFVDCTAAFTATTIDLTSTAGVDVVAVYDIGRFTEFPWLYPHICDRIKIEWDATDIDSVVVKLENAYGTRVTLGTVNGTTYARPTTTDEHYAGSWAQDWGQTAITDTGVDLIAAKGKSSDTMSSAERAHFFSLLGGWGAAKLRFEVKLKNAGTPGSLKYPTFYLPDVPARLITENGNHQNLIWPNGPGVRYGQWAWWNGTSLAETPTVYPPGVVATAGWKSSIIDWLVWKRVVYDAKARNDGLTTELASLYDSTEGNSIEQVDSGTLSFLLPPNDSQEPAVGPAGIGVMVASYAEVPPTFTIPRRARNAVWTEDGDWALESWCFSQIPRRYTSAQHPLHLDDPSPRLRWTNTNLGLSIDGWWVTEHSEPVDGGELDDHIVVVNGEDVATASPWHGYFAVVATAVGATALCYHVTPWMRHHRAFVVDDELWTGIADNSDPHAWSDAMALDESSAAITGVTWASMQTQSDGLLRLFYGNGTAAYTRVSRNGGRNWAVATTVAAAADFGDFRVMSPSDVHFWYSDGNTIKCRFYDAQMVETKAATSTNITDCDDTKTISVDESVLDAGGQRVGILYVDTGGALKFKTSVDGVTFS